MTDALIKIGTVLALLAVLFFGEQYIEERGYNRRAAEDSAAIEKVKTEATAKLATLTKDRLDAATELANLKTQMEKTRETLQSKNTADLRGRLVGPGLRFTTNKTAAGCGRSGGSTPGPAPGAAPDAGTTVVQLPEPINGNLWQYAADAQGLAIDYGVLYSYVHNPKLVCELQP